MTGGGGAGAVAEDVLEVDDATMAPRGCWPITVAGRFAAHAF
jgi:hypothetical protein